MGTTLTYPPLKPTERIMAFIDGGYVRRTYRDLFGDDNIDYGGLLEGLLTFYETSPGNPFRADLIRAYYYDAIVDDEDPEFRTQKRYFAKVHRNFFFTVRLGSLVRLNDIEFRQKGVDVLMAIDALTKAYLDHYDTGIFFLGDRDFIPLVEAIKNVGKKAYGFYFGTTTSEGKIETTVPVDVGKAFDVRIAITKTALEKWHVKKT